MISTVVSVTMAAVLSVSGTNVTWHKVTHKAVAMADCEDTGKTPCITYDDGKWRKVDSYSPYRARVVAQCKSVKGGPKYPCVWPNKINGRFKFFAK